MTVQVAKEEGLARRQQCLTQARRVVVKVGSAVLTSRHGLRQEVLTALAEDLSRLVATGREVVLVSSGAVAAGRRRMGLTTGELGLKEKQAAAALGQSALIQAYETVFGHHHKKIAQLLLTHDDFSHRHRYLNIRNSIFTLLGWGVLPIINENDPVSVEELRFGDNDTLGAMVSSLVEADLFICLTDVDALYTANPAEDAAARPVYTVSKVDNTIEAMAGNVHSAMGTGGMQSKIRAANMAAMRGIGSIIGPGREPKILQRLFAGEALGTFFLPSSQALHGRKHWIAYTLRPQGKLVLDAGACTALRERGTSLLPAGIVAVRGRFGIGDPVCCVTERGDKLAVGLVNYSAMEIDRIKGLHTDRIEARIGHKDSDEVIHRDNLVLL